jgi:5-hydroxyisourate hydrolase-like protein (transthyretin family)
MRQLWLLGLLCILTFFLVKFALTSSPKTTTTGALREPVSVESTGPGALVGAPVARTPGQGREARGEAVQEPATVTITGFVRSGHGDGIAGSLVDLVCAAREDVEWQGAWHKDDWGVLERKRFATESGPAGGFSFSVPLEDLEEGAVLMATHSDHEAGVVCLSERAEWPSPLEIVLQPARAMTVVVLDEDGQPVSGVTVEHFGLAAPEQDNAASRVTAERGRRMLHRTYITASDGTATFGPFPGVQLLKGRLASMHSRPWRGAWQERVTLRLLPTFEVGGVVSMPEWEPQRHPGERRITLAAQQRNLWLDLHTIRSVGNGTWGPVVLPLVDADRYRVRLEGAPIVPVEVLFDAPGPGARLKHDLAAELGVELWFRVTDEEKQVIPTASVRVGWPDRDDFDRWISVEASKTASEQIGVRTVPPGIFRCTASAPGYEPRSFSGLETATFETTHVAITLKKAARLRGTCVHQGRPVEDFEVIVWRADSDESRSATAFFDREDGRFELDNVPSGDSWVTATSARTPACEPLAMACEPGETVEITLELLDGIKGSGWVLDRLTGLPVEDAGIQMFVKGAGFPVARWGSPLPVNADGSFDLGGFLPGENYIRVVARGYSDQVVMKEASDRGPIDWGQIPLVPKQDFTLVVEPPERAAGATVLATAGTVKFPRQSFSPDGIAVFPGVSAGTIGISIEERDETYTFCEMNWDPGDDWTLRARLGGPNRVTVSAVSGEGDWMSSVSRLEAAYQSSQGFRTIRTKYPRGESVVEFEGIDAPTVSVQAFDQREEACATSSGVFQDGHLHLELLRSDGSLLLRVVDPEEQPLSGVRILLTDPQAPGFTLFGSTDERGECRFKGVPSHEVRVTLHHASGSRFGIPLDAGEGTADLVLDASARLELLFLDGEAPLGGVSCAILDPTGSVLASGSVSDEHGRVTISRLGAGPCHLEATRPDCWPTAFQAQASTEGALIRVQVRRLGDLEVDVSVSGLPVSGLAVELTSLEFGADVATWIAQERARSGGLVTDLHGRIRVEGLPRGPYRWRILRPGQAALEAAFELGPGANPPLRLVLP